MVLFSTHAIVHLCMHRYQLLYGDGDTLRSFRLGYGGFPNAMEDQNDGSLKMGSRIFQRVNHN